MKFRVGTKVRVVRLLDKFTNPKYLGKVGTVQNADDYGYHVVMDNTGSDATFMESELEAVG